MSENQFLIVIASGTIVQYLIYCLYLRNLSGLLQAIQPANRYMQPGKVWLLLLWFVTLVCSFLDNPELKYLHPDAFRYAYTGINIVVYVFLQVWQYRVVSDVAASIEREYQSRGLQVDRRPTYNIGIAMVIFGIVYITDFFPDNSLVRIITQIGGLGNMVLWIIYWVQTYRYKKKIQAMPKYPEQQDSPIFSNLY